MVKFDFFLSVGIFACMMVLLCQARSVPNDQTTCGGVARTNISDICCAPERLADTLGVFEGTWFPEGWDCCNCDADKCCGCPPKTVCTLGCVVDECERYCCKKDS